MMAYLLDKMNLPSQLDLNALTVIKFTSLIEAKYLDNPSVLLFHLYYVSMDFFGFFLDVMVLFVFYNLVHLVCVYLYVCVREIPFSLLIWCCDISNDCYYYYLRTN